MVVVVVIWSDCLLFSAWPCAPSCISSHPGEHDACVVV